MPIYSRLEHERQKREKYLQRKVQETLCLAVPKPPTAERGCIHGTNPVSAEEFKAQCRQYQEKLRLNRILQVRAQEMLFASKRIADFRDRKTKDSKMMINHLKEIWSEDQRRRIASLEKEYANACQSIGQSHDAAMMVERNKAEKGKLLAKQAEESRYWKTLRFEEAMQKEREQKESRERGESASTMRRKLVESVSSIERNFARRYNHGAKPKPLDKHAFGCSQTVNLPVTHDVTREKVYTKLAGFPIDFKDTYLHSRFDVLQDRTNRPSSAVVGCPEQGEVDAWRAADAQRESNRCERALQIELERLYNERKIERGSAAAAKLLSDQRIALLEQEVEGAMREEQRELDRLHGAVTSSVLCRRSTSAVQQRRPTYTKHKISNPLSCPGSVTTNTPENEQESSLENQTLNSKVKREEKPLQDPCVPNSEKQDPLKLDIQGKKLQLLDLADYQAQKGASPQKETKREMSCQIVSTHKSADGSLMNSTHQQSIIDRTGLTPESGVTNSPPQNPVQTKRKGISPVRASCVRAEQNTARIEEGSIMKHPRVKSPNKCQIPEQNADGSGRSRKQQLHVSEGAAEDISGPTKRCRSRDGEVDSKSCKKKLANKASPCKDRYHVRLVQGADEVEKEVEQSYDETIPHKIPAEMRPPSRSVPVSRENGESQRSQLAPVTRESGEIQRNQRDSSSIFRPPFISSGTIGYKKVLNGPLMPRTSKPTCEREGSKATLTVEKTSLVRSVQENFKALLNSQRRPGFNILNETLEENGRVYFRRETKSSYGVRSLFGVNNKGVETNKSWAHPLRPHTSPSNFQEQRKAWTFVNGANWPTSRDEPKVNHGLRNDFVPEGIRTDLASPRNMNKDIRSKFETWNGLACSCPDGKMTLEISEVKECNTVKGTGQERQATRVQEPKLRHKAVWKSYIDQRTQNSRKNSEHSSPIQSEPSTPSTQIERVTSSRAMSRHTDQRQDDSQSKARMIQPGVNPNARNCHTPAGSVKSSPSSRSTNGRDKSVLRSWKHSQRDFNMGIDEEKMENISAKIKSLPDRFHSPAIQAPQDTTLLSSNWKCLHVKKTNCFPAAFSTKRENLRKLDEIRSSCKMMTSFPNNNLVEKKESTRNASSKSSDKFVGDTLTTAWKTGKFQGENARAMNLQAKDIPNESTFSGVSKTFSDQNYSKRCLSGSPYKRSVNVISLGNDARQNQDNASAKAGTNHGSRMTRSDNKPWLSNSPLRSTLDQIVDDLYKPGKNHRRGSANPMTSNKSPMQRQLLRNPEASKIRKKLESTKDPWAGQSLDFVLGSLAEQVRELNERLRSATVSSTASSSTSSPSRDTSLNRDKHGGGPPEKRYKNHASPSTSSVASSTERDIHQINPPSPAFISRETNEAQKDATNGAARRTYMDELKTLLKEISSDNQSPTRSTSASGSSLSQRIEGENKPRKTHDVVKMKPELLHFMNKSCGVIQAKANLAELELDHFVSSTSASTSSSSSATSGSDPRESDVIVVDKGRAPIDGNGMANKASCKGLYGNAETKGERERALKERKEAKIFKRRSNGPQENGFREDNGDRRFMEKRLAQSRWHHTQLAGKNGCRGVQKRFKRSIEVRGSVPHKVIQNGRVVPREQLVKEVVENGLPSPEMNDNESQRRDVNHMPDKEQNNDFKAANGNVMTQGKQKQEFGDVPNQRALSNGPEKLANGHPESPLWGGGSPHCSGSWRKGAMNPGEKEDRMLLSGSVDFSPWNTEKLPDIGTPQTATRENTRVVRSSPPSPIAEHSADTGGLPPKNQRAKPPPKLDKAFGQWKDVQPNGDCSIYPDPALVSTVSAKVKSLKIQAPPRMIKKPKLVPRDNTDALWSLSGQDHVSLRPSAAQSLPQTRPSFPARKITPKRDERRTASAPKSRSTKKPSASHEETPDSTSKDFDLDDNYLPVIMAKDPESRQRVIERRKKALQLDLEHRKRMARNLSRPSSARSSV